LCRLGPLQRQPAAERLLERDDAAGDLGPDPLAELAVHLDGRPSLLLRAAELSRRYYRDIALEERLDAAALALDAPQQLAHSAWFAGQAHDLDRLWEMATAASPAARRLALAELARRPDPDLERLAAAYAAEAPARREDIAFVLDHAEFLSGQRQEHARAAEQIQDLLERIGPSAAETAELQGRRSTYLRRAGEASAAWSALEPALASDRRPVLQEGVRILLELGYLERAESLARRMYERHPQELATWVVLAETLWQQDRFAEAADLLRDAQRAAPAAERSQLVPVAFADSFEASPLERTLRAWQHLLDVQLDIDLLIACIPEVHRRGQAETSAELAERIRAPAHAHAIYLAAYPSLLELHGERGALQWLVDRIGADQLNHAAPAFFEQGQAHLLWDAFALATTPPDSTTWHWRAAAAARGTPLDPAQRLELERYYTSPARNFEDRVGQMLVGILSEDALLDEANDLARLCQAAYDIALRALGEGRYHAGARWLQIAIATRSGDTPEYVLATDARDDLSARGKTLTRLELEHGSLTVTADANTPAPHR